MGFTPAQVNAMSIWEFAACRQGVAEFHGGKKQSSKEISDDRLREMGIEGF